LRLPDLFFESPPSAHIARNDDDPADCRVIEQIVDYRFQPDPGAVLMAKTEFGRSRGACAQDEPLESGANRFSILGMHEFHETSAKKFRRPISRRPLDRRAEVQHCRVDSNHGDDVRKVLDKVPEPRFPTLQHGGSFQPFANVAENTEQRGTSTDFGRAYAHLHWNCRSVRPEQFQFSTSWPTFRGRIQDFSRWALMVVEL